MKFNEILTKLEAGDLIKRPHWEPRTFLERMYLHGIPVASMVFFNDEDTKVPVGIYSFPLNDILAEDWEIL